MTTIKVSQFGPIVRGQVELKPLTVFVGPNNSGKSYISVLLYAIMRSFFYTSRSLRFGRRYWVPGEFVAPEIILRGDFANRLREAVKPYLSDAQRKEVHVPIVDLPDTIRDSFLQAVKSYGEHTAAQLTQEIHRCWATDIPELVRKSTAGPRRRTFKISFEQTKPKLYLEIKSVGEKLKVSRFDVEPSDLSITVNRSLFIRFRRENELWLYEILYSLFRQSVVTSLFLPYYLPAARSGILQNHKALASSAVDRASMVGIMEFPEIPLFPGVVADFIRNIIELQKRKPQELKQAADLLENEVMRGVIDIEESKKEYPEIYYVARVGKFELHRTSSMVSELAPVALYLKYVINPGNILIIEEPESHLHPDNQRRMARVIARLVRSNVRVLLTTHSDFFVEQLNNFIRLAKGSPDERRQHQYSSEDYLEPGEVGAYLFDLNEQAQGTIIKKLPVTEDHGISADEFAKVNESLYDETVKLERITEK